MLTTGVFSRARRHSTFYATPLKPLCLALALLSCLALVSCSGLVSSRTSSAQQISISFNASAISVLVSQSTRFTVTLQNDSASKGVNWTLSGSGCTGVACGTLTNVTTTSVTYTAPPTAPSPATVTLKATSITDNSKSASATITITTTPAPISMTMNPTAASVQVSQSTSFTVTVQNDSANKGVSWGLAGTGCTGAACGTLTNVTTTSVTYNAPASAPSPATVTLLATSITDNTKSASATITITTTPAPISVAMNPTAASVQVSQSTGFTATVQNDAANKGVSWTLGGAGCTGAACGTLTNVTTTSVTYAAPPTAPSPATVTLKATSITDNSKSASATITITTTPAPISVAMNPTAASVQVSQSTGFTATAQNDSANKGVSWTLSGAGCTGAACGTLTNVTTTSVTYTAPPTAPNPATVTLKATSITDSTKSAAITITITAPTGGSAAPTLVTSRSASTTQGPVSGTDPAITTYVFQAPSLSLAGNAVLVGTTFRALGGSLTVALTNERGDTFTNLVDATNGADNQRVITFCGFPAAGNYQYTITFSGTGTAQYVQATMGEVNNIASCTPDAVSDNTGTSATTITAGELGALAHSGDFIFNYVAAANAPQIGTWTTGSQANIAWAKGRSDTVNAQIFQWGQYNATAGFTPTLTSSDSVDYVSEAVALPTAAVGTARPTTGIIVTGVQSIDTNGTNTGSPLTFDMPTVGNLLVLMDSEANYGAISSITSSPALTWHQVCSSTEAPQYSSPWYASNTSPSTNMRITVNFLASSNSRSFQTYDVVGADPANPLDTGFGTNGCVSGQGSQPSQGPLTVGSGTPSNPGELIIMVNSLDNNSGTGWTSPSGVLFMQAHHGPVYNVPTTNDENDPWALLYTQGVSLLTFTMTADNSQGTGGVNKWAFSSAAFK